MKNPTLFPATDRAWRMSPLERAHGRYMRSLDGHAAAGGDAAPVVAEAAGAGEGAGDDGAVDDATLLGGAGASGEGQEGAADAGEAGAGGGEEPAAGAPEKYELTAGEGQTLDTDALALAEPVLRELGLPNDKAQALVSMYAEKIVPLITQRANDAIVQQAAVQRKEWSDAFAADPEIGGANREATIAAAARAFDHYGLKPGEGLRGLLDATGVGNHPDMIRFVAGVGRDLAEGAFERGGAVTQTKAPEQKMYRDEFQPKT